MEANRESPAWVHSWKSLLLWCGSD